MPQVPGSACCQRSNAWTLSGKGRTPSRYSARFCADQAGRATQPAPASGWRRDATAAAERARDDLVPERTRRLLGLALGVALGRPRLLEHDDVGREGSDGGDIVEGPCPTRPSRSAC